MDRRAAIRMMALMGPPPRSPRLVWGPADDHSALAEAADVPRLNEAFSGQRLLVLQWSPGDADWQRQTLQCDKWLPDDILGGAAVTVFLSDHTLGWTSRWAYCHVLERVPVKAPWDLFGWIGAFDRDTKSRRAMSLEQRWMASSWGLEGEEMHENLEDGEILRFGWLQYLPCCWHIDPARR